MPEIRDSVKIVLENISTKDHSGRFAMDSLLRLHGFFIHERPKNKQPIWGKKGKLYTQKEALATLPDDDTEDAAYAQELHDNMSCEGI